MALLGTGGILELSREWPEPMALSPEAINYTTSPRTITLGNQDYWTGDRVLMHFSAGSPFGSGSPAGAGVYFGSIWTLSLARVHVTSPTDQYYQVDNGVAFYDAGPTVFTASGYINIDSLGRIRLFSTEIAAHNLDTDNEVALGNTDTGNFVVARYSANSTYTSAIQQAANSIAPLTLPSDTQELQAVIAVPSGILTISGSPDERGWLFQCDLEEWALDIDAANLDMTAIGETFGEHTKALVRGAGSLQFMLEHRSHTGEQDSLALLRLVLLTQQYCRASAKFHLYKNRVPAAGEIGGTAYYESTLLLNNSKVNVRAGDIISGSTDFVLTGPVQLRVSN